VDTSNKAFAEGTSLQKEYDNSLKGMNAQLKIAWNSIVAVAISIGQQLAPYITKAAKAVSSFLRKFGDWAKQNPKLLKGIVLVVAALGGLLLIGGAILTFLGAIGMLSVGLSALPMAAGALGGVVAAIWPIVTVVAAVIAIGYLLYKAWTTNFMGIRDIVLPILQKLKSGFTSFMKAHGDTVMAFVSIAGKVVFAIMAISGAIRIVRGVVSMATTVWRTGAMAVRFLYFSFQMARAYASYYAQAILSAMRNTLAFARTAVASAVQGLKRFAISLASAVRQSALFAVSLARQAVAAVASFATSLITGAVTAIGSFAAALVPAIAGAWAFTAALLANPITWIVLAIISLIVIIILLVKNWDKVKEVVQRVWSAVVEWIRGVVEKIKAFFVGIYQAVVDAFSRAWAWLKAFIIKWWPYILGVFTGGLGLLVGLIIQNWDQIMAFLRGVGAAIVAWITGVVNWIRMRWEALKMAVIFIWQSIQNAVSWVINTIRNIVMNVVSAIQMRWQQFRGAVAAVWNSISATVSSVIMGIQTRVQAVIAFITGLWEGLKTAVAGVWNWIVEKVSGAIATIKNKLLGLIPDWLRTALSYIGINIPAPSKKGEAYATGGYVARTGSVSATLHEGEVITPAPAVQKIVSFADRIPASGISGATSAGNVTQHFSPQIHISLPNVKEIDRQSVEELAELIIRKIEYLRKRKREAGFSNDFNPSLSGAKP
jgi:phage-related protein